MVICQNWNVSNVTNMKEMFTDASSFEGVNGLDQCCRYVWYVTDAQGLTRVFGMFPF